MREYVLWALEIGIFLSLKNIIIYRGSAIAKIVGRNVIKIGKDFDPQVNMWVFEEIVHDSKLTDIINTTQKMLNIYPTLNYQKIL